MNLLKREEIRELLIDNEQDLINTIELSGYDKDLLKDSESEFYIKAFVLFTHFPERVRLNRNLSDIDSLYNQYYWLRQICRFSADKMGSDKGIPQHLFQLIEEMDRTTNEVDWKMIEKIDKGEI
jgi:hypothetical protein